MKLSPGMKLDDYEIDGLLGAGGMGEVYRARDAVLKRQIAIKVLPASVSQDPERLRRFKEEAQAAAALNHPNILGIYRFGVFEGAPYIVSELLDGESLRQVLTRGPLSARKTIEYGVQIAHGMAAAHERGIIHRDLKPENLFVTVDGRVKILDFGLAKLTQVQETGLGSDAPTRTGGTEPGLVLGTVGYMAPEQVRGRSVDSRADIFAFGAVLYEMLTGKRAFQRSTSADTISAILNEEPARVSDIVQATPLAVQRVIYRCLEKNPEQRFQSASDLAFALEASTDSGISSESIGAAPARRINKRVAWAGGLGALLAVGVLSFLYRPSHANQSRPQPVHQQFTFVGNAYSPAISPDGRSVAYVVRDPGSEDRMMVQDLAGGPSLELLHGEHVINPGWAPDGTELSVAVSDDKGDESIFVVSRLGGTPRRLGTGAYSCWLRGGGEIARTFQNPEIGVLIVDQSTGKEREIKKPPYQWTEDLACSPKSDKLLLLAKAGGLNQIWSMRADGTEQRQILQGEKGVVFMSPRWSATDDAIVFFRRQSGTTDLVKLSLSDVSAKPSVLLGGLETGDYLSLTLDGSQLAYTREHFASNLRLVEARGRDSSPPPEKPLTSGTLSYVDPSISPDGRSVAFIRGNGSKTDVYTMSLPGGQAVRLTSVGDSMTSSPAWSPDGKRIAFIGNQGGTPKVWIVNSVGGEAQVLDRTDASGTNYFLSWSPNSEIVYTKGGLHNFWRLDADTQQETPVLPQDSRGWLLMKAEFSPNRQQIAVHWNRLPTPGAWLINLQDRSETLLGPGLRPIGWSPDGRSVYAFNGNGGKEILQIELGRPEKPHSVAAFSDPIHSGSVSPDGRQFIVSLSEDTSDVWILKNFDAAAVHAD